jgi:rubrerythrin
LKGEVVRGGLTAQEVPHWKCKACSWSHDGLDAPSVCPKCGSTASFYKQGYPYVYKKAYNYAKEK